MPSTCGAGVLNSRWVITADHCIMDGKEHSVVLGKELFDYNANRDKTMEITIEKIIKHSNKSESKEWADLALLRTAKEIPLLKYTPICLPPSNFNVRGKTVTVAGWGLTGTTEDLKTPETVREIRNLRVVPQSICKRKYVFTILVCAHIVMFTIKVLE